MHSDSFISSEAPEGAPDTSETIGIFNLVRQTIRRWRLVIVTMAVVILLCALWMSIARPLYRAQMMVMTPPQTAASLPSGTGSALGGASGLGLISSLGLGSNGNTTTPFAQFRRLLDSIDLAEQLQRKYGMLQIIYADRWDAGQKAWRPRFSLSSFVNGLFGLAPKPPPNINDLADYIAAHLTVTTNETGLLNTQSSYLTLSFTEHDRDFAAWMLKVIHEEADGIIRQRDRQRAESDSRYLRQRFGDTNNVSYREIFINRIALTEQTLMMLSNPQPYAAVVFDNINSPLRPYMPKPLLYLALSGLIGLLLGLLVAAIHAIFRGDQYEPQWPFLPRFRAKR